MSALLIAVSAAFFGALVTWVFGSGDRKQAKQTFSAQQALLVSQQRITQLEAERGEREDFARFSPRVQIIHTGKDQLVLLEADELFRVDSMDYLNATGAKFASQEVNLTGTSIEIPINQSHLVAIRNAGPVIRTYDNSAEASFRFNISKSGKLKQHTHKVLLTQGVESGTIYYTKVVG